MRPMLNRWVVCLMALLALTAMGISAPAYAHKEHTKKRPQAAHVVPAPSPSADPAAGKTGPAAMHAEMGEAMEGEKEDRSTMTSAERLLDWFGRLHPIVVHFPSAFFPAALFAAVVGRRRPVFARPVQFLVVAGGIIAPIAAVLGWLDGGFDIWADDWLLQWHRWLGTGVGAGAFVLALWALRKPEQDRGTGMIAGLAIITAAIIVQGWFGGAMVHGIDHMNW